MRIEYTCNCLHGCMNIETNINLHTWLIYGGLVESEDYLILEYYSTVTYVYGQPAGGYVRGTVRA